MRCYRLFIHLNNEMKLLRSYILLLLLMMSIVGCTQRTNNTTSEPVRVAEACKILGGTITEFPSFPNAHRGTYCLLPTLDANAQCSSSSQCQGKCIPSDEAETRDYYSGGKRLIDEPPIKSEGKCSKSVGACEVFTVENGYLTLQICLD